MNVRSNHNNNMLSFYHQKPDAIGNLLSRIKILRILSIYSYILNLKIFIIEIERSASSIGYNLATRLQTLSTKCSANFQNFVYLKTISRNFTYLIKFTVELLHTS